MNRAALALLLTWGLAAHGQCVDSSAALNFAVRKLSAKARFSLIPAELQRRLAAHHGESYSADRALAYEREVKEYLSTNPRQERYEALFSRKLSLSASARLVTLACVEVVPAPTCIESFSGQSAQPVPQCVDVVLTVYAMDLDILKAGHYALP